MTTTLLAAHMYRIDLPGEQARLLEVCFLNAKDPEDQNQVARLALDYFEDAMSGYRYSVAQKLSHIALQAAKIGGNQHYQRLASQYAQQVEPRYESWKRVAESFRSWKEKPEDPELNAIVGRFLAFVANDWEIAIPCLAMGSDKELQDLATLSLDQDNPVLTRIRIADRWSAYAEKLEGIEKENLQRRVRFLYREVQDELDELNGLDRNRVMNFLRSTEEGQDAELRIRLRVDGWGVLTIQEEEMAWRTSAGVELDEIQVNQQKWNPLEGELQNRGSTRFMPGRVNLETASISVVRNRGVVRLVDASPEAVQIRVSDIPKGVGTYEFVLTFSEAR